MPAGILRYALRQTGRHQVGLALLSVAFFALSAAPLELQRRIINVLTEMGGAETILWLAVGYAFVALAQQALKLLLSVYRGWVAESTVRALRRNVLDSDIGSAAASPSPLDAGVEIALILEEAEPIGGFTAMCVSEPLLQGGMLLSVIGYMIYLQPRLAVIGLAFFVPQMVFVPVLQRAINRRAQARILTKRTISGEIADKAGLEQAGASSRRREVQRIFSLNMGIYWLKYVMNLLMNLMHHLAVTVALCVGGWMVLQGRIEVGTVVAIVGGLGKLNDPWGDLVDWAREFSVVNVKYKLFVDALAWLTGATPRSTGGEPSDVADAAGAVEPAARV